MACLLGYIWADGSLRENSSGGLQLRFHCAEYDREILDWIKGELQLPHKIGIDHYQKGDYVRLELTHREAVGVLVEEYGLKPRKTYLDLPYLRVPDEFLGHFLRGYSIGDGCFSKTGVGRETYHLFQLHGSELFLTGLRDHLVDLYRVSRNGVIYLEGEGNWITRWTSREDMTTLHKLMFPDGEYFFLKRKRKRFEDLLQAYGQRKTPARCD